MDAEKRNGIGLTIQNTQLVQLIHTLSKTMTPQQINQHMETLLIIGHICAEMGKQDYVVHLQNHYNSLLKNRSQSVDEMKQVFDNLVSCRNNSSRKGKLSENIAIRKLQQCFPESEFVDTSQTSHSGDCHGTVDTHRILYEFKDYGNLIPKKEIVKFHRDLKAAGFRLGVFCSNLSGITGKKSIDWELLDNHTLVVYISGMGMNGSGSCCRNSIVVGIVGAMVYDTNKGFLMRQDVCWERHFNSLANV